MKMLVVLELVSRLFACFGIVHSDLFRAFSPVTICMTYGFAHLSLFRVAAWYLSRVASARYIAEVGTRTTCHLDAFDLV
jgi:hypothetical protein